MLRKVLGAVLLVGALSGCTGPVRVCSSDGDCGEGGVCDEARHLCYSSSTEIPAESCQPSCAPYEACTATGCVARYTALVVTPGDGGLVDGGPIPVRAELVVRSGVAANFPETLSFSGTSDDGGTGGTFTAVTRNEGVYTTNWTPPGEGVFLLKAAYSQTGGPSTTVNLAVDTTAPTFAVTVPAPDAGVSDGGTTYADPVLPNAWRRDQVAQVEVRTNEPHLDPRSITVALQGTDGGLTAGVGVTPFTGGCDAGFCGVAQVKLWEPAFDAFRSPLPIVVRGSDSVGNAGSLSAVSVNVTRWKWMFDSSAGGTFALKAPPAVGAQGVIYFGVSAVSTGKVLALKPDGTKLWEVGTGAFASGPTVGALNSSVENVYVGVNSSNMASLLALNGSTGAEVARCDVNKAQIGSNLVLTQISSGGSSIETAVGVVNVNVGGSTGTVGSLIAIRPQGAATTCNSTDPVSRSQSGVSPMVIEEDIAYFADSSGRLTSYQLGSSSVRAGWPVSTSLPITGLAMVSNDIVGANGGGSFSNQGQLFLIPKAGGVATPPWRYPATTDLFVNQLSVASSNAIFFGSENLPSPSGTAGLATVPLSGTRLDTLQSGGGSFKGAPAIGRGGVLFTAGDGTGLVGEWSTDDFTNRWLVTDGIGPSALSPALDCARDEAGVGRAETLGVLYVADEAGKLYAFVVDSRGLDTSAPWPKYQHDARNTGNPATPITSCP